MLFEKYNSPGALPGLMAAVAGCVARWIGVLASVRCMHMHVPLVCAPRRSISCACAPAFHPLMQPSCRPRMRCCLPCHAVHFTLNSLLQPVHTRLLLACPAAVFLSKNAVLSSFASGKQTSLVVDAGHERTVGALLLTVDTGCCCRCCWLWLGSTWLALLVLCAAKGPKTGEPTAPVLPGRLHASLRPTHQPLRFKCCPQSCNCGIVTVAQPGGRHAHRGDKQHSYQSWGQITETQSVRGVKKNGGNGRVNCRLGGAPSQPRKPGPAARRPHAAASGRRRCRARHCCRCRCSCKRSSRHCCCCRCCYCKAE